MVHLRRKILSFGNLINQLQQSVRWSSSLKIKDKNSVQPQRFFKYADLSVRLAGPDQLNPKPDVNKLSFGKYFTDHMLKIHYYEGMNGWQAPEIMPFENIVLHPAAKVLHYAVELFEGMKAYRGVDGKIRLFRPELNMERMNNSAIRTGLPPFRGEELIKCICRLISIDQEWVPHSTASSLYIRPTLIGIDPTLGVATSDSALLYVILTPVGSYFKSTDQQVGISLLADPRYTRAWPGGCGDAKLGSNYGPTIQVQQEAIEKGLQQVLWLYGENNELTEIGTMNVFIVYINDNGDFDFISTVSSATVDNIEKLIPICGDILKYVKRIDKRLKNLERSIHNMEESMNIFDGVLPINSAKNFKRFEEKMETVKTKANFIKYMNKKLEEKASKIWYTDI